MITFSGIHCTLDFGAPSARDLAVQLMRIPRFAGAGRIWYPVGIHCMLVADLVAPEYEAFALLHDAPEAIQGGDLNQPFKTGIQRIVEGQLMERIYHAFGLTHPDREIEAAIKVADNMACNVEGAAGCAARGFAQTHRNFKVDRIAAITLEHYLHGFNPMDAINPDGKWPLLYEKRLLRALRALRNKPTVA